MQHSHLIEAVGIRPGMALYLLEGKVPGGTKVNEPLNGETTIDRSVAESAAVALPTKGLSYTDAAPSFNASVLNRSQTILLVEDEAFVREVTVQVLKAGGYEVLMAKNANEAYRLYDQFSSKVDLLLTDLILPDGNGRTLAQKLRNENTFLPILFVTGYAEQVEMLKSEPAGLECLLKPFSARTLLEKVRTLLDKTPWGTGWRPVKRACGTD